MSTKYDLTLDKNPESFNEHAKELLITENKIESPREKTIGVFGGLSIVVGCIIGSGIFITVGETMKATPPSVALLMIYWCLGGIISLLGGICYAELGSIIPKSGGERTYFTEAFGFQFGVTFTYIFVFLVKTITLAVMSLTIGKYFVEMILPSCQDTESVEMMIAAVSLFAVFIINSISKKIGAQIQIIFTVIKLLALSLIVCIGFADVSINGISPDIKTGFNFEQVNPFLIGVAFINVFWSMEGWNTLGAVVGDMRRPSRDLPISIIIGVSIVVLFYCMVILAYIQVLGYNYAMNTLTVAISLSNLYLKKASFIIPLFICCSAFGAVNGNMMSVARISMMSSYEGEIPGLFSLVRRTKRTPTISLFFLLLGSLVFLPMDLQKLLNYCAFVTWMFYFIAMSTLFHFRIKRKDLVHKFRVPIFIPLIVMLVAVFIIIMSFKETPAGCGIILGLILFIFGIHFLPPHILRPKPTIKFHNIISNFLQNAYDLEPADKFDVS